MPPVPRQCASFFLGRDGIQDGETACGSSWARHVCGTTLYAVRAAQTGKRRHERVSCRFRVLQSVSPLKKVKREAAAQRRPARSERKTAFFPRNDRPYGLKRAAFQTEIALIGESMHGIRIVAFCFFSDKVIFIWR